jgi:hypothetical protein
VGFRLQIELAMVRSMADSAFNLNPKMFNFSLGF